MEEEDAGVAATETSIPLQETAPPPPVSDEEDDDDMLIPFGADMHRYKPVNCCERYCCGGLQGMACGWPKGTVRAIIAVLLLVIAMGVEAFLVVWLAIRGNDTAAIGVGGAMLAELGGAVGFYFGSRSSKKDDDTTHRATEDDDDVERGRRRNRRNHNRRR